MPSTWQQRTSSCLWSAYPSLSVLTCMRAEQLVAGWPAQGAHLASFVPRVSWGTPASWASSIPLQEFGEFCSALCREEQDQRALGSTQDVSYWLRSAPSRGYRSQDTQGRGQGLSLRQPSQSCPTSGQCAPLRGSWRYQSCVAGLGDRHSPQCHPPWHLDLLARLDSRHPLGTHQGPEGREVRCWPGL